MSDEQKLTEREGRFAYYYAVTGNGAASARQAGYTPSAARQAAYELLSKPYIKAAIEREKAILRAEQPTKADLIDLYKRALFFDPRTLYASDGTPIPLDDIDIADRLLITNVGRKSSQSGLFVSYEVISRETAAEKLSALLGWSKNEIDIRFKNLSDEELDREIEEASKKLKGGADGN